MVLSDFLSRQKADDSNPHKLIPISFSLKDQVSDYFLGEKNNSKPLMRSNIDFKDQPVLHLPDRHGCFQLYSDTSKFATGSVLYQIQNGQPRLIAYASKRMQRGSQELFHHRIGNVWIGNEHHYIFASIEKG